MKVAVLSESPADEAAIRIFAEGLLGRPTEMPGMPPLRTRGWPRVCEDIPRTLKHLHYRTDAEALIVVVDSDRSPVHDLRSQAGDPCHDKCRLCLLSGIVRETLAQLHERPRTASMKVAIGIAVPQIEAWYLVGRESGVSEATWINAAQQGYVPYDGKRLKRLVYSTDRPSIDLETTCALEHSRRIVANGLLDNLVRLFPGGFGALAHALRNWC